MKTDEKTTEVAPFDIFWSMYPRKIAKGSARKSFARALTLASMNDLMNGLERSRKYWSVNGTDDHFIPHAATWLNQERWDDVIEDKKPYIL